MRAHSQESVMTNKAVRILISSSRIVSKTVTGQCQQPSNCVCQFPGAAAFVLICDYRGKAVLRVNTRHRMYLASGQRK